MFGPIKKSKKTGLAPGTPVYIGDNEAQQTAITVINYCEKNIQTKAIAKLEECLEYRDKPSISWINIVGLHDIELIEGIGQGYGLHPLVIEDILNTKQRPKIDVYDDFIFLSLKLYSYDRQLKALAIEQVSLILGKGFVITFQEKPIDVFDSIRERLQNPVSLLRKNGADYLAYRLIDVMIDSYFSIVEQISDVIENIENELIVEPTSVTMQEIHSIKREIIFLRKSVWPLRDIINEILRTTTSLIHEKTMIYFRDVYDHAVQVIDTVETHRDLIGGLMDLYMSIMSNRMNVVMKVLTIFAAIFIPLTFLAGLYGMNFNTAKSPFNMPELNWYWGYPFALGLMTVVAVIMLIFFKRKKWF